MPVVPPISEDVTCSFGPMMGPLSPWFAVSTAKVLRVLINPLDPLGWSGLSVSALGGKDGYLGDETPSSNGCRISRHYKF